MSSPAGSSSIDDCYEYLSCPPGTFGTQNFSDPCACDIDGIVGGVNTYKQGCKMQASYTCYVTTECPTASPSSSFPGARWRSCDPLSDNAPGSCAECPPGTSNPDKDGSCIPCPAGTYSATNGTATCTLCEPGKFIGGEGATGCSECAREVPAGSASCPAPFVEGGYPDMKAKFGNGAASEEAVKEAGINAFVVRAGRYARVERGRRAKRGHRAKRGRRAE
jgi:hypothetical protein